MDKKFQNKASDYLSELQCSAEFQMPQVQRQIIFGLLRPLRSHGSPSSVPNLTALQALGKSLPVYRQSTSFPLERINLAVH